jgi:purine-binding chemotaxis protein CheW
MTDEFAKNLGSSAAVNGGLAFESMEEDAMEGKYLTFRVGHDRYGIAIRYVTEIVGVQKIIEVPELPDYMLGIISLRGQVIPVMDARMRFHHESTVFDERTCIIIIDLEGLVIGLIVDRVDEVVQLKDQQLESADTISRLGNKFVESIGKLGDQIILIVNPERIMSDKQLNELQQKMETEAHG